MDRKEWLKDRQNGVGGTDVASLAGVGFLTAEQVYEEKVAAEPIDRPPSPVMAMGTALEDHNAELYARRTGATLHSPGLVRAESLGWAFATLDRVRIDQPAFARPVELKYAAVFGDEWGDDGTDQVRDSYIVQANWQIAVLRDNGHHPYLTEADLSAVDGWGNHRVYTIPYSSDLVALLLELAEGFWRRVERREGLDGWDPPVRGKIAAKLAAIHPDTAVVLGSNSAELADAYVKCRDYAKLYGERADEFKAQLVEMLGSNEVGILPDGRRVRQRELTRKSYTVAETKYRDFRILNPKKEKPTNEQ